MAAKIDWTDANVDTLKTVYQEARESGMSNAEAFAELQKLAVFKEATVPQLRGKAVIAGFYTGDEKAKGKGSESGAKKQTKAQVVGTIETILSVPKGALASLDKATAKDLNLLCESLIKAGSKPEFGEQ